MPQQVLYFKLGILRSANDRIGDEKNPRLLNLTRVKSINVLWFANFLTGVVPK